MGSDNHLQRGSKVDQNNSSIRNAPPNALLIVVVVVVKTFKFKPKLGKKLVIINSVIYLFLSVVFYLLVSIFDSVVNPFKKVH